MGTAPWYDRLARGTRGPPRAGGALSQCALVTILQSTARGAAGSVADSSATGVRAVCDQLRRGRHTRRVCGQARHHLSTSVRRGQRDNPLLGTRQRARCGAGWSDVALRHTLRSKRDIIKLLLLRSIAHELRRQIDRMASSDHELMERSRRPTSRGTLASMSLSSVGHGKRGRLIRRLTMPCSAVHTATATTSASPSHAASPLLRHSSIPSTRPCRTPRPADCSRLYALDGLRSGRSSSKSTR